MYLGEGFRVSRSSQSAHINRPSVIRANRGRYLNAIKRRRLPRDTALFAEVVTLKKQEWKSPNTDENSARDKRKEGEGAFRFMPRGDACSDNPDQEVHHVHPEDSPAASPETGTRHFGRGWAVLILRIRTGRRTGLLFPTTGSATSGVSGNYRPSPARSRSRGSKKISLLVAEEAEVWLAFVADGIFPPPPFLTASRWSTTRRSLEFYVRARSAGGGGGL